MLTETRVHCLRAAALCCLSIALFTAAAFGFSVDASNVEQRARDFLARVNVEHEDSVARVISESDNRSLKCRNCFQVEFASGEVVRIRAVDGQIVWYSSNQRLEDTLASDINPAPDGPAAVSAATAALVASGFAPEEFQFRLLRLITPGNQTVHGYWDVEFTRRWGGYPFHSDFAHVFVDTNRHQPILLNKKMEISLPNSLEVNLSRDGAVKIASEQLRALVSDPGMVAWSELRIVSPNGLWLSTAEPASGKLAWVVGFSTALVFVDAESGTVLGGDRTLSLPEVPSESREREADGVSPERPSSLTVSEESVVAFVARHFLRAAQFPMALSRLEVSQSAPDCKNCWRVMTADGEELVIRLLSSEKQPYGEVQRFNSPKAALEANSKPAKRRLDEAQGRVRLRELLHLLGMEPNRYEVAQFRFLAPNAQHAAGGVWHATVRFYPGDSSQVPEQLIRLSFDAGSGRLFSLERHLQLAPSAAAGNRIPMFTALGLGGGVALLLLALLRYRASRHRRQISTVLSH